MFCVVGNNNSSNSAAVSFPSLRLCCNLQHRNTVKCQTMVVKEEGGGGLSGERPICNYFLLNQHKVGSLTVLHSGLDQDHLWCWLKKGASSAGTQGERCSISLQMSKIVWHREGFDRWEREKKKKSGLWGLLPFMVSTWMRIKAASYFDVFYTIVTWLKC